MAASVRQQFTKPIIILTGLEFVLLKSGLRPKNLGQTSLAGGF
jgi:hypothetical protein